jgi:hypothetical protein
MKVKNNPPGKYNSLTKFYIKSAILFLAGIIPLQLLSQTQKGNILSNETKTGIGFVNIGIIGRNIGTVADKSGNYSINLTRISDKDSIRFSMIGYDPKTFLVGEFRKDSTRDVYLSQKVYCIPEFTVVYHKPRRIVLGDQVTSDDLRSGFGSNDLGSELGIKVNSRNRVRLENINLNVSICTYDSVTYRLNIYQSINSNEYLNILNEPVYLSFTKDKIKDAITFDLTKYSIIVEGNIMIALELYRDLGEGRLLFHTAYFTGTTYHRKSNTGTWSAASGVVGIYLRGVKVN